MRVEIRVAEPIIEEERAEVERAEGELVEVE
jgi:hypothetical protein